MTSRTEEKPKAEGDRKVLCQVRLDREMFVAPRFKRGPTPRFKSIPGFKNGPDRYVRQQGRILTYRRVRELENPKTGTKLYVRQDRARGFLSPYLCTAVANDLTGILWPDLQRINDAFGDIAIRMVELAFDFDPASGVDLDYVRKHALIGKCRPVSTGAFPDRLRYGSRRSMKMARCYWKEIIKAFRVELQLISYNRGINNYFLYGFACDEGDFRFVDVDWRRLDRFLIRNFHRGKQIVAGTRIHYSDSLHSLMDYLRKVGVNNTHIFLKTAKKDALIREALDAWRSTLRPGVRKCYDIPDDEDYFERCRREEKLEREREREREKLRRIERENTW